MSFALRRVPLPIGSSYDGAVTIVVKDQFSVFFLVNFFHSLKVIGHVGYSLEFASNYTILNENVLFGVIQ